MLVCVDCCLGLLLVFAFYCYLLECVVWLFGLFVGYVGYLFGGLLCFGLRLWLLVVFVCFDCVAFGLGLHWLCLWFMVFVLVCYVGDLGGLGGGLLCWGLRCCFGYCVAMWWLIVLGMFYLLCYACFLSGWLCIILLTIGFDVGWLIIVLGAIWLYILLV